MSRDRERIRGSIDDRRCDGLLDEHLMINTTVVRLSELFFRVACLTTSRPSPSLPFCHEKEFGLHKQSLILSFPS